MGKGKRYETDVKLNYQKVFAVIIAIAVIVMFVIILRNVLKQREQIFKKYEYFALYSADKWGIIDQEGKTVIEPSYQEMIVIPNKTKDVFICMYDINEATGEYQTKAINSKNEEIFTEYEQIEALENIDQNGNMWFEESILKTKKDGKFGLIDLNGKEILKNEYDEIKVLDGISNSILVKKDGKVGLVNGTGSVIAETKYNEIKNLGETYKEGYITVDENNKYGLISATKKQILENKYENISQVYLQDYYLVTENGEKKLINSSGETILKDGFDDIKSKTTRGFIFVKNNSYGEISLDNQVLINAKYQELKEVEEQIYIAKQGDKYGIIDATETIKVPFEYTSITYNEKAKLYLAENSEYKTSIIDSSFETKINGILSEMNEEQEYIRMRIGDEYKYYNFKCVEKSNTEILKDNDIFLSKKDNKYGYVNKKGDIVVDYIYDDATEQNEYGFAAVKKDGVWGSIGKDGNQIIEPKYNLENNLKIDFIGKWHLGQDLNMNYYCEK